MTNDPHELGPGARRAVATAEAEAVAMGSDRVGTEHLLLGLLADGAGGAARLLHAAGTTLAAARHKVRQASPPVPERARPVQPPLPTTPRADLAVARALRFCHSQRAGAVTTEHLLWGVLDVEGTAGQVLRGLGVDVDQLRTALETPRSTPVGDVDEPEPAVRRPLRCPSCGVDLDGMLASREVEAAGDRGPQQALVLWCSACGHVLGATPA